MSKSRLGLDLEDFGRDSSSAVDTFFFDNGSTFIAASNRLSESLGSTEFHNGLRKRNINWVRIPPYAPSQGGSWESLVKVFKSALFRVLDNARRMPSLIELQTFFLCCANC